MPKNTSLSNGVWLETQIVDARGEVFSAPTGSNGLSNKLEVAWLHSWRAADIRVTHDVVQGGSVVSYQKTGQQWVEPFTRVRYGHNRTASGTLLVGNQAGQAVFDCSTVEVWDIWAQTWVPASCGLQFTLQIT